MAKKTSRAGRTLLIFFICVAVLYGLAALGGTWKPRLGLDLEGGTRITLTAIPAPSRRPSSSRRRSIIDARVNGSGVAEAEVTTQGNKNIVVEIPGKNRKDLVDSVKRTAQLRFRHRRAAPAARRAATSDSTRDALCEPRARRPHRARRAARRPSRHQPATVDPEAPGRAAPAPAADADPTPSPTATATSSARPTAASPTATPTATPSTDRAPAAPRWTTPIAWSQNPGAEWLAKFAAYTCPPPRAVGQPVADNPTSR